MKNPWAGCHCWLPSCIVFRMHEKDTTTEIHFPNDTRARPSSVILATYWMGKQPILANEYLQMKQETPLEECLT